VANVAIRSFAGGELAPALHARTDLQKYQTGLRTCRNALVARFGGVYNRAGTMFVGSTKADGAARLLPFIFDAGATSNVAVLEFTERAIRFHQAGARVVTSGVSVWQDATAYAQGDLVTYLATTYYCTADHTSATATDRPSTGSAWQTVWHALEDAILEVPTPYLATDLAALQWVQSADVLTLVHPGYPPYELRRLGATTWVLVAIAFGPAIGTPTLALPTGGVAITGTSYYAITAVSEATGEESLAGYNSLGSFGPGATPIALSWGLVPGADEYRIYRGTDGSTYGFIAVVGGVPSTPTTDSAWGTPTGSVSTTTTGAWIDTGTAAVNALAAVTATTKAYDQRYTVTMSVTATTTITTGTPRRNEFRVRAFYQRNTDASPVDAGIVYSYAFEGAGSSGPHTWSMAVEVPDDGYTSLTIRLEAEVKGSVLTGTSTFACSVTGTSVVWTPGALAYSDGGTPAPDYDLAPPTQPTLFSAEGEYPAAVGYFQQRRLFANTAAQPETIFASRTASHASFARGLPLTDDDRVIWTLAGRQAAAVRHLADVGALLALTSSGVHVIEGDESGILTPTGVNPRRISGIGAGSLRPLEVNDSLVYVGARGAKVYDVRTGAVQESGYQGNELSVFAAHLVDGYTLVDWDVATAPHPILWAVRDDGTLLGCTYLREHGILAWHRHDTDGLVENVCVVPEGDEDAVYLVVQRTIDGATVRYVERLVSRTLTDRTDVRDLVFMDSALSYDGRHVGATTLTLTGTVWDGTELLVCTASGATFAASNVDDAVVFYDADGVELLRCTIETYTSAIVVGVRPSLQDDEVPAALQAVATTAWGLAVDTLTGLEHLEGCEVSVYGDGYVLASPNNDEYGDPLVVTGGELVLPEPACVVHVGLPYVTDIGTLDLDTASGTSMKATKMLVKKVHAILERSRGIFAGQMAPEEQADDGPDDARGLAPGHPLYMMGEAVLREREAYDEPVALYTGTVDISLQSTYDANGRVLLRQVDPLPLGVLALIPAGDF
jgi:hypothetical protein